MCCWCCSIFYILTLYTPCPLLELYMLAAQIFLKSTCTNMNWQWGESRWCVRIYQAFFELCWRYHCPDTILPIQGKSIQTRWPARQSSRGLEGQEEILTKQELAGWLKRLSCFCSGAELGESGTEEELLGASLGPGQSFALWACILKGSRAGPPPTRHRYNYGGR